MTEVLKMPLHFDANKILEEILELNEESWLLHFNKSFFEGDWSVIPLRSLGGESHRSFHNPAEDLIYQNTRHLPFLPYTRSIIDSFKCEKTSIRFMRLGVDSSIKEHEDYRLSLEDEDIRIHIPVQTHDEAEFWLNGKRVQMQEGECWYLNFNLKHRLFNPGPIDRIHLVMDLVINDWVREHFEKWTQEVSEGVH